MHELDPSSRTTILAHYYRAMVGRADIWRTRMDATTNWAIVSMAAVLSFALGSATVPHYVVLTAPLMTAVFLMLEARRLTFYHLWQQRALLLEDGLVRAALRDPPGAESPSPPDGADAGERAGAGDLASALEPHLGRTVPTMPLFRAVGRRLRRVYLYLFAVQGFAWLLKLANPAPGAGKASFAARADIGLLSGEAVLAVAGVAFLSAALAAWLLGRTRRNSA